MFIKKGQLPLEQMV